MIGGLKEISRNYSEFEDNLKNFGQLLIFCAFLLPAVCRWGVSHAPMECQCVRRCSVSCPPMEYPCVRRRGTFRPPMRGWCVRRRLTG